jgi:hypothetical protein
MIERKIRTNPDTEKTLDQMRKIQRNKSQIHLRTKLDGTKCKSTQRERIYQEISRKNMERIQRKNCTLWLP